MKANILEPDQYNRWDAFVDQSPQGDIFCYSWWLEAVTKSNFKILIVEDNGEIVAGFPLAYDAQNRINVPPVTRTLGVLFKNKDYKTNRKKTTTERKLLREMLKYIPLNDFVQMNMHHSFTDWLPFRWNGFSQTTRYTYIVNYKTKSSDDPWKNLERENRRIIKKAKHDGIRMEITDDFELMYRYESLSYERQGLKFTIPYADLKLLDDSIKNKGKRVIFKSVDDTGQVHAIVYIVFNRNTAYALLSGSDPNLRKFGGHTLVLWEALKYFSDKVEYFNFCGSDIEQIEAHIRGFGGTITPYFNIYNEKLMWKRTDTWYHFGEIKFHFLEILKIIKNKTIKAFSGK